MSAIIIDGKKMSDHFLEAAAENVKRIKDYSRYPVLAIIKVGNDPASEVYVRNKIAKCTKVGIRSILLTFSEEDTTKEIVQEIKKLNDDNTVTAIMVQLPLPENFNKDAILSAIDPEKDVDAFNDEAMGRLVHGTNYGVLPCTALAIHGMLLNTPSAQPMEGKHAVIVGRSNIVGKPIAAMLLNDDCTVTVCHSHTKKLAEITRTADILIVAVGKPKMITADMVKPGAVVIDVGINRVDGKLCGDVDFDAVKEVASAITPVPGGVGQMTTAQLVGNTIRLAERKMTK